MRCAKVTKCVDSATAFVLLLMLSKTVASSSLTGHDCSKIEHDRCVKMADPLVKEPHLVFPDNLNDIDRVCRTWTAFVDCLKRYTERCFTKQQRVQFNRAIEDPIESVHEMCRIPHYQKEYLRYASCIKGTITERNRCGQQYGLLVDQVEQGEITSKATLCCTQDRFKRCVLKETRRTCDRGGATTSADGAAAATRFAAQIIDKALSFLQDQCFNYIPNSGDCVPLPTDSVPYTDPLVASVSPNDETVVYPWSTVQEKDVHEEENDDEAVGKDLLPPRPSNYGPFTTSWLPSSSEATAQQEDNAPSLLGSRTRPASYGRSGWTSETTPRLYPTTPASPSTFSSSPSSDDSDSKFRGGIVSTSRPDWVSSNWHDVNRDGEESASKNDAASLANRNRANFYGTSTETWYPAAGNQLANEVDEPNQQGLTKHLADADDDGSGSIGLSVDRLLTVGCLIVAVFPLLNDRA